MDNSKLAAAVAAYEQAVGEDRTKAAASLVRQQILCGEEGSLAALWRAKAFLGCMKAREVLLCTHDNPSPDCWCAYGCPDSSTPDDFGAGLLRLAEAVGEVSVRVACPDKCDGGVWAGHWGLDPCTVCHERGTVPLTEACPSAGCKAVAAHTRVHRRGPCGACVDRGKPCLCSVGRTPVVIPAAHLIASAVGLSVGRKCLSVFAATQCNCSEDWYAGGQHATPAECLRELDEEANGLGSADSECLWRAPRLALDACADWLPHPIRENLMTWRSSACAGVPVWVPRPWWVMVPIMGSLECFAPPAQLVAAAHFAPDGRWAGGSADGLAKVVEIESWGGLT